MYSSFVSIGRFFSKSVIIVASIKDIYTVQDHLWVTGKKWKDKQTKKQTDRQTLIHSFIYFVHTFQLTKINCKRHTEQDIAGSGSTCGSP